MRSAVATILRNLLLSVAVCAYSADDDCVGESGTPLTTSLFGKEGECKKYYQCVHGHLYIVECPYDLVFNSQIGHCDYANNVRGCEEHDGIGPEEVFCRDGNGDRLTQSPFLKPGTCDVFYQCVDGRIFELQCPANLRFNPSNGVCDYPHLAPPCDPGTTQYPPVYATTTTVTIPTQDSRRTTNNEHLPQSSVSAETTSIITIAFDDVTTTKISNRFPSTNDANTAATNQNISPSDFSAFLSATFGNKMTSSSRNHIDASATVATIKSTMTSSSGNHDLQSPITDKISLTSSTDHADRRHSTTDKISLTSLTDTNIISTARKEKIVMTSSRVISATSTTTTTRNGVTSLHNPRTNVAHHLVLPIILWYIFV